MTQCDNQFVDAKRLLELLFDEASRPSLRWLREQQGRRAIPFVKLGRLVFFSPPQVREALNSKFTVKLKGAVGL
jgi:hypothetical protein